jgi:hypothetical protein
MCSQAAHAEEIRAKAAVVLGATCAVMDMSASPTLSLPDFETSRFHQATVGSRHDLSLKRNIGLALGRLLGWRRILFLDDDIFRLDSFEVTRAASGLDYYAAVGIPARYFPDNSVVCHAYRLCGGQQGVFVSGSTLAVDLRRTNSFFPNIYNEDWLFLAPYLDERKVSAYGSVCQHRYLPFEDLDRARTQEFGDILAEGLIGYIHSARLRPPPPIDYWTAFLESRAALIAFTMKRCQAAAIGDEEAGKALRALEIAEQVRSKISATTLTDYVDAWLSDLVAWRRFLSSLPSLGSLTDAIRYFNLQTVTIAPPHNSRISGVSPARLPTGQLPYAVPTILPGVRNDVPTPSFQPDEAPSGATGDSGRPFDSSALAPI